MSGKIKDCSLNGEMQGRVEVPDLPFTSPGLPPSRSDHPMLAGIASFLRETGFCFLFSPTGICRSNQVPEACHQRRRLARVYIQTGHVSQRKRIEQRQKKLGNRQRGHTKMSHHRRIYEGRQLSQGKEVEGVLDRQIQ